MEGYAGRMEIVAGPTGRRRPPDAEKGRIAAESLALGAVVAGIARRYGAMRWQVYNWLRRFRRGLLPAVREDVSSPAFIHMSDRDYNRPITGQAKASRLAQSDTCRG